MKSRNEEIDFLRGISIFVMIWVHTNAYFLHIPLAYAIWDFSEFAVPIFIFCSAYLYFKKDPELTLPGLISYVKRRIVRLLVPYYIFLALLFVLVWKAEPTKLTKDYISGGVFLSGQPDINWLVVLFLWFSFLIPMIQHTYKHRRIVFYLLLGGSIVSSIFFLSHWLPINYRLTMWAPWMLIVFFTLYVVKNEHKRWFFPATTFITGGLYLLMLRLQFTLGHSIVHYENKYPPNLYHLSFGLFTIMLFYWLFKFRFWYIEPVRSLFRFLSAHSYSLYFVHWLVIFVITVFYRQFKFYWIDFFTTIFGISIIAQMVLNEIFNHYTYLRSTLKSGPTI